MLKPFLINLLRPVFRNRHHRHQLRAGPVLLIALPERRLLYDNGNEWLDDFPLRVPRGPSGRALRALCHRRRVRLQPLPQGHLHRAA